MSFDYTGPNWSGVHRLADQLSVGQCKTAAAMWAAGHGTYMIAIALFPQAKEGELPENRVYNSLKRIKRIKGK